MKTDYIQAENLVVKDPETVKVILHPLRMRLATALAKEPRTVRELAEAIGREPTKLYYHVKLLLKAGLVVVAGERQVGNLTETSYILAAKEITVDPSVGLNGGEADAEASVNTFITALRQSLLATCRRLETSPGDWGGKPGSGKLSTSLGMGIQSLSLRPGEAEDFQRRLRELVAEYERRNAQDEDATVYELGWALYEAAGKRRKE